MTPKDAFTEQQHNHLECAAANPQPTLTNIFYSFDCNKDYRRKGRGGGKCGRKKVRKLEPNLQSEFCAILS